MRNNCASSSVLLLGLLAGCTTSEEPTGGPASPLPPPPTAYLAPMTDAVRELYGEWHPVSGPGVSQQYRLTIWSPMFSWGSGCNVSQGQLRDLGENRFTIEYGFGGLPQTCRSLTPLAPFDGADVSITMPDSETLRVERGGEAWLFAKVDVAGTYPSDSFIRGEWLLADMRGRPYRGDELTRVTFGAEYRVDGPNCSVATNAWFGERDWEVRVGGSYIRFGDRCRVRTLGDRLAKLGTAASYLAEPIETRMTLRIPGQRATLVPAARFPELARNAEAFAPDQWARELAEAAAKLEGEKRSAFAVRAVGLGGEGSADVETPADPRRLVFSGLMAWQHARAVEAGLLASPPDPPEGLRQHLASAPIIALAVLEGIRPVDRGDGLSLDYLYRVREGWRGGQRTGDLLIVRMPPLEDKSRSPLITPALGTEVLLLASRTGYIAGRLFEGIPPSSDTRVVQMTLPLMRIVEDKLVEAADGANVLGAASFAGTSVDAARELARSVEERMRTIAPLRPADNFGNPTVRRFFITRIGDRELSDPTRLWIEYDFGGRRGSGETAAYFDGCTPIRRINMGGKTSWVASAVACPGTLPNGSPVTEPAVANAVRWIEENNFPSIICTSACPEDPKYTVPLPDGEVIMRAMLR